MYVYSFQMPSEESRDCINDDDDDKGVKKYDKVVSFFGCSYNYPAGAIPSPGDRMVVFRSTDLKKKDEECQSLPPRARFAVTLATVASVFPAPLNIQVEIEDSIVSKICTQD